MIFFRPYHADGDGLFGESGRVGNRHLQSPRLPYGAGVIFFRPYHADGDGLFWESGRVGNHHFQSPRLPYGAGVIFFRNYFAMKHFMINFASRLYPFDKEVFIACQSFGRI